MLGVALAVGASTCAPTAVAAPLPWAPPPVNECGETGFDPALREPDPNAPAPPLLPQLPDRIDIPLPYPEIVPVPVPGPQPDNTRIATEPLPEDPCADPCPEIRAPTDPNPPRRVRAVRRDHRARAAGPRDRAVQQDHQARAAALPGPAIWACPRSTSTPSRNPSRFRSPATGPGPIRNPSRHPSTPAWTPVPLRRGSPHPSSGTSTSSNRSPDTAHRTAPTCAGRSTAPTWASCGRAVPARSRSRSATPSATGGYPVAPARRPPTGAATCWATAPIATSPTACVWIPWSPTAPAMRRR